jgi:hypothetical protein
MDFSGVWELDLEESRFGFLPPPQLRVDTVEQSAAELRVVSHQIDDNGDNTVERRIPLDGSAVEIEVLGRPRKLTARIEATTLVVETRFEVSGRPRLIEDRWSLSQDGALLTGTMLTIQRRVEQTGGAVRQTLLFRPVPGPV